MPGLSEAKLMICVCLGFCLIGDPRFGNPSRCTLPTTAFLVTPSRPPISLVERPSFQSAINTLTRFGVHSSFIFSFYSLRFGSSQCPPFGTNVLFCYGCLKISHFLGSTYNQYIDLMDSQYTIYGAFINNLNECSCG